MTNSFQTLIFKVYFGGVKPVGPNSQIWPKKIDITSSQIKSSEVASKRVNESSYSDELKSEKNPSKIGLSTQRQEVKRRQELGLGRYDARIAALLRQFRSKRRGPSFITAGGK